MRDECLNVVCLQSISFEKPFAELSLFANRILKDRLPVLVNEVHLLSDSVMRRGVEAAASGHLKGAAAGAIDFVQKIDEAQRIFFGWLQNHRSRAIAKDDASGAIGVVYDGRHYICPNHHDFFVGTRRNELCPGLQGIDERGTGRREVESPDVLSTELVLHQAGC